MALNTHINLLLKQIVAEEITNLQFLLSLAEAENRETSTKSVNKSITKKIRVISRNHTTQWCNHYFRYEFPHFSCHLTWEIHAKTTPLLGEMAPRMLTISCSKFTRQNFNTAYSKQPINDSSENRKEVESISAARLINNGTESILKSREQIVEQMVNNRLQVKMKN